MSAPTPDRYDAADGQTFNGVRCELCGVIRMNAMESRDGVVRCQERHTCAQVVALVAAARSTHDDLIEAGWKPVSAPTPDRAGLREVLDDLCPHEPDEHPEGTCEVCDYAFAVGVEVDEWFAAHQSPPPEAETVALSEVVERVLNEHVGTAGEFCRACRWQPEDPHAEDDWVSLRRHQSEVIAARLAERDAGATAALSVAVELEDPRVQRPGMQRRREWATRIRRAVHDG